MAATLSGEGCARATDAFDAAQRRVRAVEANVEPFIWCLRTLSGFAIAAPICVVLTIVLVLWWDYPVLLLYRLYQRAFGRSRTARDDGAVALPILVVLPSLLRKRDELRSMLDTVESVVENGYPGDLTLVVSIDGAADAPDLYDELRRTISARPCREGTRIDVTGTPGRRGKPMAIEHAIAHVKGLVAAGTLSAFPPVYVSTDADADLGPRALERIVYRLQRKNRITGWPARAVAGSLHVRGNGFWSGWRNFFTVEGQLTLQVAREYYVGNVARYNIRWLPVTGIPGAFYCTWSEIFLAIPDFLGYSRTLRLHHWLRWWIGLGAPKFSESTAAPLPELMAGDTDDTVTAYVCSLARYRDGHFDFDPPRTPIHAFFYLLRSFFVDRPLQFEPEAHVYTSSPSTLKSLFKQRKRWNAARVELTGRLLPVLGYHWSMGFPGAIVILLMARSLLFGIAAYILVPVLVLEGEYALTKIAFAYLICVLVSAVLTFLTMAINDEFRWWRLALALPLTPLYNIAFRWVPGAAGVTSDVFLFGNQTGFAPEWTLQKGGSARLALLFRLRRALSLAVRSIVYGDVPLGAFWFGWRETEWSPSGFDGWTTGKRRRIVPPLREWFGRRHDRTPAIESAPRP